MRKLFMLLAMMIFLMAGVSSIYADDIDLQLARSIPVGPGYGQGEIRYEACASLPGTRCIRGDGKSIYGYRDCALITFKYYYASNYELLAMGFYADGYSACQGHGYDTHITGDNSRGYETRGRPLQYIRMKCCR